MQLQESVDFPPPLVAVEAHVTRTYMCMYSAGLSIAEALERSQLLHQGCLRPTSGPRQGGFPRGV